MPRWKEGRISRFINTLYNRTPFAAHLARAKLLRTFIGHSKFRTMITK